MGGGEGARGKHWKHLLLGTSFFLVTYIIITIYIKTNLQQSTVLDLINYAHAQTGEVASPGVEGG